MSTSEAPAGAGATVINVQDSGAGRAGEKAPKSRLPAIFKRNKAHGSGGGGWKRCVAFFDFVLRICGIAATLTAAILMGTTNETLPFFTQFFQFHANYSDLPAMTFFVIANGIVAGYLVLSLMLSVVGIIRPQAAGPRFLLLMCDTVMLALLTAAASSATAIVYLAHNGDSAANWVAICLRFDGFCQNLSGSVVASFVGVVFLMLLVIVSGCLLRRKTH